MPITKSAKKALRQDARKRERNDKVKQKFRELVKQVRNLATQKKTKEAIGLLPQLFKALDKASKAGVIKKNAASRKKSRLAKFLSRS